MPPFNLTLPLTKIFGTKDIIIIAAARINAKAADLPVIPIAIGKVEKIPAPVTVPIA